MIPPSRSEQIKDFVKKATESLDAAEGLLRDQHEEFAVSRAYYAMFYITEALLLTKGLTFSKHSGVIAAFGEHFVKTGTFKPELREMLIKAFADRTEGDYGRTEAFSAQQTRQIIDRAKLFFEALSQHLAEKEFIK